MLLLFSYHLHVCGHGVHVCLSVCTHTYMGKICMHVGALGWHMESSSITPHCVHWGRVSYSKPGLTERWPSWLSGSSQISFFVFLVSTFKKLWNGQQSTTPACFPVGSGHANSTLSSWFWVRYFTQQATSNRSLLSGCVFFPAHLVHSSC